jgi:hypothetical protein
VGFLNWGIFSSSGKFIEDFLRNLICWRKIKTRFGISFKNYIWKTLSIKKKKTKIISFCRPVGLYILSFRDIYFLMLISSFSKTLQKTHESSQLQKILTTTLEA